MEIGIAALLLSGVIFFVYGTTCVVSIIFTLFKNTYRKIDEKLNLEVFSTPKIHPLDRNINFVNDWMIGHNKIVGPFLIVLSIIDIKSGIDIINRL